jgi:hypothetical protein
MPLNAAKFNLNFSGVAGFFGGKETVNAMSAVNIYGMRKYLGWYNSPGSYNIGMRAISYKPFEKLTSVLFC